MHPVVTSDPLLNFFMSSLQRGRRKTRGRPVDQIEPGPAAGQRDVHGATWDEIGYGSLAFVRRVHGPELCATTSKWPPALLHLVLLALLLLQKLSVHARFNLRNQRQSTLQPFKTLPRSCRTSSIKMLRAFLI